LSRTLRALDNRRGLQSAGREPLRASQPANPAVGAFRQASLPARLRLIRGDCALVVEEKEKYDSVWKRNSFKDRQ